MSRCCAYSFIVSDDLWLAVPWETVMLCTRTFTERLGKTWITSQVSTCSITPGYEEIRLGSYPIMDKNNSHIHPALFSPFTVTWLKDNTAQVVINQAACLSLSICLHVSCFPVTVSCQFSHFTFTRAQTLHVFLCVSPLLLHLIRGFFFFKISWKTCKCHLWLLWRKKVARHRTYTFNITKNAINWCVCLSSWSMRVSKVLLPTSPPGDTDSPHPVIIWADMPGARMTRPSASGCSFSLPFSPLSLFSFLTILSSFLFPQAGYYVFLFLEMYRYAKNKRITFTK